MINVIDITDAVGLLAAPEWISRSEKVHRQLRPKLPEDYHKTIERVFRSGGRMSVAVLDDSVVGLAVYRIYENTALGTHMYVDDLVTDEVHRSKGIGHMLIEHLSCIAKRDACQKMTLDSGTQRQEAHKFYFREDFRIVSFHFHKQLDA